MASSSETMGSSPSCEDSSLSRLDSEKRRSVRGWTQFELATVCALICKQEHRGSYKENLKTRFRRRGTGSNVTDDYAKDWVLRFATKLNEALHGVHGYKHDIPVDDVRELMDFIETKNKAVMAYIERQSAPFRVTRSKKYAFQRLCHDFNDAFSRFTIPRRERLKNPDFRSDVEISRLDWTDHDLSCENQYNNVVAEAHAQRNAQLAANTERGRISDSAYAQRSRKALDNSVSRPKAPSSQYTVVPRKSAFPSRHHNQRRVTTLPPPPPPPPPARYEQMTPQPFDSYNMARFEVAETERGYYSRPDSTPSATWYYPPASPAFFGHDDLRQSIHPMGPKPDTPMTVASPAYQYLPELHQRVHEMGQQPETSGSFTPAVNTSPYTPIYDEYHYPEPPQKGNKFNYSGAPETPISPSSPMHMLGLAAAEMMEGQAGALEPVEEAYGTHYTNSDLYPQVSQYY